MTHADFNDLEKRDYFFKIGDRGKGILARYDKNTDALIFPRAPFDYVCKLLNEALSQEPCEDAVSKQHIIDTYKSCADMLSDEELKGADLVMEWVNNAPPVTQKPIECDDAISREAVIKDFTQWRDKMAYSIGEDYSGVSVLDKAIRVIKGMPSVTQKSGAWVEIDDEPHEVWECDHCGFVIDGSGCIEPYEYRDTYKFCPNCGAKMVEPQESNTEKHKPCVNYEDGCEEWAGCPCIRYKAEDEPQESEDNE